MKTAKPTFGAFNQGQVPTIACFNRATVALGVNFNALIAAMQAYVNQHIVPIWGTPAKLIKTTDFVKDAWAMVFLDNADQPGALAYHDLTPGGLPLSKVFVKTTLADGELVSVSASHELVEMLVDPAINMMTTGPDAKTMYAYESADPVEALNFDVKGIAMSDFVYPSYFEVFRKTGSAQFDHLNKRSHFRSFPAVIRSFLKAGSGHKFSAQLRRRRALPAKIAAATGARRVGRN
jgi:hypothetical protein